MRLQNKIALITGAARGIGRATAELFHKEGAVVIVSDIRDEEGRRVAENLGGNTEYIHLDVGNENEWATTSDYISDKYGKLDILVNNAGITGFLESTGPWDAIPGEGEQRQNIIEEIEFGIPLGHFGEPIDVAYGVLYLASDESKYLTGIELTIDGGILAGSEAKPK
jgi:3(or 17)beta-hydroxysteroid dehydrogenase